MADNSLNVVVKLTGAAQASAGLKDFADDVEKTGKSIGSATAYAQNFTKVVAAMSAVVAGYALAKATAFEKEMSNVKALLGPTAEEFEALSEQVKRVGVETKYTQEQIAQTMAELGRVGVSTADILSGATDATATLAAATGTDLVTAATVAASTMQTFGIAGKDMAKAVNQITGAANLSKLSVNDFSLAVGMGGSYASQVGVNFEEFTAAITATSAAFNGGSDAGTSFKTFLMMLTPTTDKAMEAMEKIGFSAYDASGKLKSIPAIADNLAKSLNGLSDEQKNLSLRMIFGSDAARMAGALAKEGAAGIQAMMEQISKVSAADQAAVQMDNFDGSLERLKGTVDVLAVSLGDKIKTVLRPAVDALTEALGNMAAWWNNLSPGMQKFIIVAGAVAAAITALLLVVGTIGIAITTLMQLISGVAAAFAFLISPVGLVILAIVALGVAIFVFRDEIGAFLSWLGAAFASAWDAVVAAVTAATTWISDVLSAAWQGIQLAASVAWEAIKTAIALQIALVVAIFTGNTDAIKAIWARFWEGLKILTSAAWEALKFVVSGAWEGLKGMFSAGAAAVTEGWTSFAEGLGSIMEGVWEGVKATIAAGINWVIDKVNAAIESINSVSGEVGVTLPTVPRVSFEKGGVVPGFQSGGFVPGGRNPAHHDQVPALLDPGELILNRAQQGNVAAALSGGHVAGGYVVNVSVSGNSFYGSDSDFAEKVGDAIFARFNQHQAIPSF